MKILYWAVSVAWSLPAIACPNLQGNFICDDGFQRYTLSITQTVVNGITTYQGDTSGVIWDPGFTFVADGVRRLTKDPLGHPYFYVATCRKDHLVVKYLTKSDPPSYASWARKGSSLESAWWENPTKKYLTICSPH